MLRPGNFRVCLSDHTEFGSRWAMAIRACIRAPTGAWGAAGKDGRPGQGEDRTARSPFSPGAENPLVAGMATL